MKADARRFTKEKLFFLAAAVALCSALYSFLASAPVPLAGGEPISAQSGPARLCVHEPPGLGPVDPLLMGGRASPFRPPRAAVVVKPRDDGNTGRRQGGRAGGGSSGEVTAGHETAHGAPLPAPEFEFVGIVIVDGRPHGLLQTKPDGVRFTVKPGDVLSQYGYTVTRIGKQAIHLTDATQQAIVLTDGR